MDELMNIYVGNLPYSINESELAELFEGFGSVARANVIIDRETGRSKGFGFVEMDDQAEAEAAIEALNGSDMSGRPIRVNEARPRTPRPRRPRRRRTSRRWPPRGAPCACRRAWRLRAEGIDRGDGAARRRRRRGRA